MKVKKEEEEEKLSLEFEMTILTQLNFSTFFCLPSLSFLFPSLCRPILLVTHVKVEFTWLKHVHSQPEPVASL